MPGMRLTRAQVRRLWNLSSPECDEVVDALISDGFLVGDQHRSPAVDARLVLVKVPVLGATCWVPGAVHSALDARHPALAQGTKHCTRHSSTARGTKHLAPHEHCISTQHG